MEIDGNLPSSLNSSSVNERLNLKEVISKLEAFAEITRSLDELILNKVLSLILYKHQNQLRRQKSLQYAKKVKNMFGRLDCQNLNRIIIDLICHVGKSCDCIWKKGDPTFCEKIKIDLVEGLIIKSKIITGLLRALKKGLEWSFIDLNSKTFGAFNTFIFAHLSRTRIVMIKVFHSLLELLSPLSSYFDNEVASYMKTLSRFEDDLYFKSELTFSNGSSGALQLETINSGGNQRNAVEDIISFDTGVVVSRKELLLDPKVDNLLDNDDMHASKSKPSRNVAQIKKTSKKSKKKHKFQCFCWKCKNERKHFKQLRESYFKQQKQKKLSRRSQVRKDKKQKQSSNYRKVPTIHELGLVETPCSSYTKENSPKVSIQDENKSSKVETSNHYSSNYDDIDDIFSDLQ